MIERFHSFGTKMGIQPEVMQMQRWLALGLNDLSGKAVLDVGCAEGWFSMKCLEAGAMTIMSIDCERFPEPEFAARVTHRMAEADDPARNPMPQNGVFDVVLCLRSLYHMRDPILALWRMRGAMKREGVLYLEMWFDNPSDKAETMTFLGDEPRGMRWSITAPCMKHMMSACGFSEPQELHFYMGGNRRIWKATGR